MGGDHGAVLFLVEHNTEIVKPFDCARSVADKLLEKLGLIAEVTAAESVNIVDCRRIIRLVSRLDSALRHHGVGVADTKLGDDHRVCTGVKSFDRCRRACSAAADDENVNVIFRVRKVNILAENTACTFKKMTKLRRNLFPLIGADMKRLEACVFIVGMVFFKKRILFVGCHLAKFHAESCLSCCFNLFDGSEHFFC